MYRNSCLVVRLHLRLMPVFSLDNLFRLPPAQQSCILGLYQIREPVLVYDSLGSPGRRDLNINNTCLCCITASVYCELKTGISWYTSKQNIQRSAATRHHFGTRKGEVITSTVSVPLIRGGLGNPLTQVYYNCSCVTYAV